jgi:3',5'-cyclic AMP phosphodiesterase CpdA
MRILHISDVHVQLPPSQLPITQLWNKRAIGLANLMLRRWHHFSDVPKKLAQLVELAEREHVDAVICTGDYTALGTTPEISAARAAIDGLTKRPLGFATVPGNHDIYLPDAVRDGRFEAAFGDLIRSDMPEHCVDGPWPCVRLLGDSAAVVAVNSARPNPQPWRSSGRIPDSQLEALTRVLADVRLSNRFVFVITHYAVRKKDGGYDRWSHGLENVDAFVAACSAASRGAVLHGHIHWRMHLRVDGMSLPVFGSGSSTHAGREGLWLFELDGTTARAIPGDYHGGAYRLLPGEAVSL